MEKKRKTKSVAATSGSYVAPPYSKSSSEDGPTLSQDTIKDGPMDGGQIQRHCISTKVSPTCRVNKIQGRSIIDNLSLNLTSVSSFEKPTPRSANTFASVGTSSCLSLESPADISSDEDNLSFIPSPPPYVDDTSSKVNSTHIELGSDPVHLFAPHQADIFLQPSFFPLSDTSLQEYSQEFQLIAVNTMMSHLYS